jgi:hypothetical protein
MWGVCLVFYAAIDHWLATRYFTPGMLPLAALMGLGIAALAHVIAAGLPQGWGSRERRSVLSLGVLLVVLGLPAAIWMIRNPYQKEDWRGLVTWLGENRPSDHLVLLADPLHRDPIEHHAQRAGISLRVEVPSDVDALRRRASEEGDCSVLLPRGLTSGPVHDWVSARSSMESPIADFQVARLEEKPDSLIIAPDHGEVSGGAGDDAP